LPKATGQGFGADPDAVSAWRTSRRMTSCRMRCGRRWWMRSMPSARSRMRGDGLPLRLGKTSSHPGGRGR